MGVPRRCQKQIRQKGHAASRRFTRVHAGKGGRVPINHYPQSLQRAVMGHQTLHIVSQGHGGGYIDICTKMQTDNKKRNRCCCSALNSIQTPNLSDGRGASSFAKLLYIYIYNMCVYAYLHVCIYIYICIYVYVYTYTHADLHM